MTKQKIHEMIRVNHAGEMGAKVIYDGQIAAFRLKGDKESLELVKHMKEQEDEHFIYFDNMIKSQQVRPTIMQPIWQLGGFALGFITAIANKKAAMTCTTAIEEVIDEHYQEQLDYLEKDVVSDDLKKDLQSKISKFREEELEHRDIGYENDANKLFLFKPLSSFIKCTTKLAIAISKKA